MYGIGFNAAAPAPGTYAMPGPGAMAMPAGYAPAGFAVPAFPGIDMGMAAPMPPERFINAHSGGVLLDKAGAPVGRIPEGSFVDAKEGKLHGPDGKPIAIPAGGSFDLFDMPDVAELVTAYKEGTAAYNAMGGGKGLPMQQFPMHQFPISAVDGQWGPGGVVPIKGGAIPGMPGCDTGHGTTQVGGAHGGGHGMMPPGKVYGGGGVPALSAQMQQMLMQAQQLIGGSHGGYPPLGMVAGVNGGGALDAMASTGRIGGVPGLQSSLNDLVQTLRQLTMALQQTTTGGGATPPAKVDTTKPVTETSTSGSSGSTSTSASTSTSS